MVMRLLPATGRSANTRVLILEVRLLNTGCVACRWAIKRARQSASQQPKARLARKGVLGGAAAGAEAGVEEEAEARR